MNTTNLLAFLRATDLPNGMYVIIVVTAATIILAQFLHALISVRRWKRAHRLVSGDYRDYRDRYLALKERYDALLDDVTGEPLHLVAPDAPYQASLLREYAAELRDLSTDADGVPRTIGRALEDMADELDPIEDETEDDAGDALAIDDSAAADAVAEVVTR